MIARPQGRAIRGVGGALWCVFRMSGGVIAGLLAAQGFAADPTPVMIQSAPGRFEISALDASVAHAIATEASLGPRQMTRATGGAGRHG